MPLLCHYCLTGELEIFKGVILGGLSLAEFEFELDSLIILPPQANGMSTDHKLVFNSLKWAEESPLVSISATWSAVQMVWERK